MEGKKYKISYLPLFYDDLLNAVNYIAINLNNEEAAQELINLTQTAIEERLINPEAFEKYPSMKERKYPYYRIYVKNFVVYYVVLPDEIDSDVRIMEVRRFLYNRRDTKSLVL